MSDDDFVIQKYRNGETENILRKIVKKINAKKKMIF